MYFPWCLESWKRLIKHCKDVCNTAQSIFGLYLVARGLLLEGTGKNGVSGETKSIIKYCSRYCFTLMAGVGLDKQGRCQILIKEPSHEQKV